VKKKFKKVDSNIAQIGSGGSVARRSHSPCLVPCAWSAIVGWTVLSADADQKWVAASRHF